MSIETVDDIVEQLADECGVYGAHQELHPDGQCECRCCWTSNLKSRLTAAFEVERKLDVVNWQSVQEAIKKAADAKDWNLFSAILHGGGRVSESDP